LVPDGARLATSSKCMRIDRSTAWGKNARADMRLVMAWSTGFTAFVVLEGLIVT
jgi:hypothetical protein